MYRFVSELQLLQTIQESSLGRIVELEEELENVPLLTPRSSQRLIEKHLWDNSEDTARRPIYQLLADAIVEAIGSWKKHSMESDPELITVWIRYDSTLYHDTWARPTAVAVSPKRNWYESYHWTPEDPSNTETVRRRGPVEIWFPLATRDIQLPSDGSEPPSALPFTTIHDYLSKLRPCWDDGTPITTITFYSAADPLHPNLEERRILARSRTKSQHLYVPFTANDTSIYEALKAQLLHTSINLTGKNAAGENEAEARKICEPAVAEAWLRRHAFWLRNVIMRTAAERESDEPPLLKELLEPQESKSVVTEARQRFQMEQRAFADSARSHEKEIWRDLLYNSMTHIRVHVPETTAELGSITILSDRVVGPALTDVISTAVWPVFAHLRQVEEHIISRGHLLTHALRSAVAAILSRNWAHIFSSQVLVRFKESKAPEDEEKIPSSSVPTSLLDYIITRSEYVADVTGEVPLLWGSGRVELIQQGNRCGIVRDYECTGVLVKLAEASTGRFSRVTVDVQGITERVGFPFGAAVGRHALYGILENYIRNVSKYGYVGQDGGELHITLIAGTPDQIFGPGKAVDEGFVNVTLNSNTRIASDCSLYAKTAARISALVEQPIIQDTGALPKQGWGVQEMKIHACLLAGSNLSSLLSDQSEQYFHFEREKAEETGDYAFSFRLRRFQECLVLRRKAEVQRYTNAPLQHPLCDFVVVISPDTPFYTSDSWHHFPSRVCAINAEIEDPWLRKHVIRLDVADAHVPSIDELYTGFWKLLCENGASDRSVVILDDSIEATTMIPSETEVLLIAHRNSGQYMILQDANANVVGFNHTKATMIWLNELYDRMEEAFICPPDSPSVEPIVTWLNGIDVRGDWAHTEFRVISTGRAAAKWRMLVGTRVLLVDNRLYEECGRKDEAARQELCRLGITILPETLQIRPDLSLHVPNLDIGQVNLASFQIASFHLGYLEVERERDLQRQFPLLDRQRLEELPAFLFMHTSRGRIEQEFVSEHYWFKKIVSAGVLLGACAEAPLELKIQLLEIFLGPQQAERLI